MPEDKNVLKRRLNMFQGAALILGCMIGSGIFTNPHEIMKNLKGPIPALIVWVFGACIAYFGAMTYAELTCRVPISGGDAPFLESVYTKPEQLVSYLYTWCRVFFINPGYSATAAIFCSENILRAYYILSNKEKLIEDKDFSKIQFYLTVPILVVVTLILMSSNKISTVVFSVMTLCSVLVVSSIGITFPLLLLPQSFIFTNVKRVLNDNFDSSKVEFFPKTSMGNIATSLVYVLWAYDGWSNLAASAGEILNPQKTIPAAHLIGISFVAIIYILVNLSFMSIVPIKDLMMENLPNTWISNLFPGSKYAPAVMACLISICTASCCFMTSYSSSRIAQAAGEARRVLFHGVFAKLNGYFGTPVYSLAINLLLSTVFCSTLFFFKTRGFFVIVDFVSYQFWIFCLLTVIGLLYIKLKEKTLLKWNYDKKLGLRVFFVWPVILSLTIIFFLVFSFFKTSEEEVVKKEINTEVEEEVNINQKYVMLASVLVLVLGIVPYYFQIYRFKIKKTYHH